MKVFLMFKDKDFISSPVLPLNTADLIQDLELNTMLNVMSSGDKFLAEITKNALLDSLTDVDEIRYRQEVLKDCLANPDVINALYQIPLDAIERKTRNWLGIFSHSPTGVLNSAVQMMDMLVELLHRLKTISSENKDKFNSTGFIRFFNMIEMELNDDYFRIIENHLKQLKLKEGVLISAELGKGNEGDHYVLRLPNNPKKWVEEIITRKPPTYSFSVSYRDDAGTRALAEIKDRGINSVANALAQAAEHIESFFNVLRKELAFYIGCINLKDKLTEIGNPICFPIPYPQTERRHHFKGLYDANLSLTLKKTVVGNDINADNKKLALITGANQGGKSTFLRSIGVAQLMLQSGMFTPAVEFGANVCSEIFTHYRRKEDSSMKSGKLDEELGRMSVIIDQIKPDALMLFNESFAATNEREGSEIAWQISRALLDRGIKIFFVTHMYEFASKFYTTGMKEAIYLRAERKSGGRRTFRLISGEPLPSSYGQDLFYSVFGASQKTR